MEKLEGGGRMRIRGNELGIAEEEGGVLQRR